MRILRLVHLIEQMKDAIEWHSKQSNTNYNSIENYRELKKRYEKELLEILSTELNVQIPAAASL